jgi:hypothetical protein
MHFMQRWRQQAPTTHLSLLCTGTHEQCAQQLACFDDVADACPALDISSACATRLLVSTRTLPLLLQLLQITNIDSIVVDGLIYGGRDTHTT